MKDSLCEVVRHLLQRQPRGQLDSGCARRRVRIEVLVRVVVGDDEYVCVGLSATEVREIAGHRWAVLNTRSRRFTRWLSVVGRRMPPT